MEVEGCSPELQKEWSVVEIKHKSNILELFTEGSGYIASLAIPRPKVLHGFSSIYALFHLTKDHGCPPATQYWKCR